MMNEQQHRSERGQALIQVALSMVVLLLCAGLATDVGYMYTQRRHMQNAADAGALAGARELCLLHTDEDARSEARIYARDRNGALTATAVVSGNIVIVTATIPVQSFLARLVGLDSTDVHAVAKAACGAATKGCGIFPIAFDIINWNNILPCGQKFLVWADDNYTALDGLCNSCDCLSKFGEYVYSGHDQIGMGDRGYLLLPIPVISNPDDFPNKCGSCGAPNVDCWIKYDWPGQADKGECIPNQPGILTSNLLATIDRESDIVRIVLWDYSISCTGTVGTCGSAGNDYPIAGFGCIQIERVYVQDISTNHDTLTMQKLPPAQQGPNYDPTYDCPINKKAILVTKLCECPMTVCGATSGTPVPLGGVGAVSLVP